MCGPNAGHMRNPPRLARELAADVNSYMRNHGPLKVQCLLSDREFSGMVTGVGHAAARVSMISRERHGPFTYCAYSMPDKGADGELYSLQQGVGVLLLSGERGRFFDHVAHVVKMLHPEAVAPFTESSKIRGILAGLEENAGVSLKHKRSVKKGIAGGMPRTALEWSRTVGRRHESVAEAFAGADKSGLAIDSLRAFTDENGGLDVTVSRRSLITVHRGDIEDVYDNILRPIIDDGIDRQGRFSHRSRSERPNEDPRPLMVRYREDVLADDAGRSMLCRVIAGYPRCNYMVVCAGNPHIYISILDRTDNSSIAVRSVGKNALAIMPQIRTSAASLLRLTAFLASSFCGGTIGEYGKRRAACRAAQ